MINLAFALPKNPKDSAWYAFRAPEPVAFVYGITIAVSSPADVDTEGTYSTPGDAVVATDLTSSNLSVPTTDLTTSDGKTIPAGLAVTFKLSGGAPGVSYAIEIGLETVTGSTLYRSAILYVTGL
jgi:hypothetical protein